MNKALVLACGLASAAIWAGERQPSISVTTSGAVETCEDIRVRFGEARRPMIAAREEREVATIPRAEAGTLRVDMPEGGGVIARGWDRDVYEISACVAAGGPTGERAGDLLRDVTVRWADGRVQVDGPAGRPWTVYVLVRAPVDAAMDLGSHNGPIGLTGVSGRVLARSVNGPISLDDCRGEVQASTENGPISLDGGGGRHRLSTENGPISIHLDGSRWDGEGVEAHTDNGPLSLHLPRTYGSLVSVEASWHAPFKCRGSVCDASRDVGDDEHRSLLIGEGSRPPVVTISTDNGPVSIEGPRGVEL